MFINSATLNSASSPFGETHLLNSLCGEERFLFSWAILFFHYPPLTSSSSYSVLFSLLFILSSFFLFYSFIFFAFLVVRGSYSLRSFLSHPLYTVVMFYLEAEARSTVMKFIILTCNRIKFAIWICRILRVVWNESPV